MKLIPARFWADITNTAKGNKAEAARRLVAAVRGGLEQGKFKAEQVSFMGVASALGLIDPHDIAGSVQRLGAGAQARDKSGFHEEALYMESPVLMSNAFQTVCQELISASLIEGYNSLPSIADQLVTTQSVSMRNGKVAGFTHLAQSFEVPEGHPYPRVRFGEKWVSMKETKKGVMIELTEEFIGFDQTGQVARLARNVGEGLRSERDRDIIRGVIDADSGSSIYVYRPSGVGEALYASGNLNLKTSNALVDWTDVDNCLQYRATTVVDDRIDGTQRPLGGLNNGNCILLVPEALRSTAWYIKNSTGQVKNTNSAVEETSFGNPVASMVGDVLSSPLLDAEGGAHTSNWYYGDFKRQFVWSEIWPLQSFVQGSDSEAAFETDVVLRVKARYYGGLSALDSIYVTKNTSA